MQKNVLNVVIFLFLAAGLFILWRQTDDLIPKKKDDTEAIAERNKNDVVTAATAAGGAAVVAAFPPPAKPPEPPKVVAAPAPPAEPPTLIALGDDTFNIKALLTTKAGGVQQVVLPNFGQANRLGKPVFQKDASGSPTKALVPLHLIPGKPQPRAQRLDIEYEVPALTPGQVSRELLPQLAEPSFAIFHYPAPDDPSNVPSADQAKYPKPLLGEMNWKIAPGYGDEKNPQVKVLPEGAQEMAFEAELGAPYFVKFTRTYTLAPKDYHIGLKVKIERLPGGEKGKGKLRYQLSGPRNLPIEGEWYTSIFRAAVIGWLDDKNKLRRQYEDAAGVAVKRGGDEVTLSGAGNRFKYMGVSNQFFASVVAVEDAESKPWAYVRATTEVPFDREADRNLPQFEDVTVRAASGELDLAPGQSVTHGYLLYNGPAKVGLLKLMASDGKPTVDPALVDHYKDDLGLYSLTDYRSDTWLGRFLSAIYWSDLVIACTNLMHLLLALVHSAVWNWALSIVAVTVFVRLLLFVPSRKQTAMSMRMMEVQKRLQPELEKLQEKYKDDPNTYNREKMRLMMAHGANPFAMMGGCLLLLAQMPIMMGLYFCLQESVFFRLEPFLWVDNLAAPDMLVWWTEQIPYVSTPADLGSFIYLGPFFNILPILAVGLMLYQQAKMMPPATDPQAEQQRMMMKIMMVMMAFFFYKVAAGLALYFIVSTSWAIIERQFIPKPKIKLAGMPGEDGDAGDGPSANGKPADAPPKPKGWLARKKEDLMKKLEEAQKRADEMSKRQIRNDSNQGGNGPGQGGQRRDKKRRK